jgi:hypothetical protein
MELMNTSKTTVRLDAEHRAAELEMMTPHDSPRVEGMEHALRRIGLRPMNTVEAMTPRYRIIQTTVTEFDGSKIKAARVAQALRAVRNCGLSHTSGHCSEAA